jgi:hypothetical protein
MPLQATSGAASYDAFGGGVPVVPNYIEDVFSTYTYIGNGNPNNNTQTITNGLNLSALGGLVWTKSRSTANTHNLEDSQRGLGSVLRTSSTFSATASTDSVTSFTSSGYTLGPDLSGARVNADGYLYVSWTFAKQPKFFDIVTWTGDGTASKTISHNLGSAPGFITCKATSTTGDWWSYHRATSATPNNDYGVLNSTNAWSITGSNFWAVNSTTFTANSALNLNTDGVTYVAYLFAHDAGGFGLTGTDNVISCGSFTTNGSGQATVSLGYEPQWVMIKSYDLSNNWIIGDNMRGAPAAGGGGGAALAPNLSNAEFTSTSAYPYLTNATGFSYNSNCFGAASSGVASYIYIAIRRGPMKVPTSGTSVFSPNLETTSTNPQTLTTGFPVDLSILTVTTGTNRQVSDRLRGGSTSSFTYLLTDSTASEVTYSGFGLGYDNNTGIVDSSTLNQPNAILWNFRRAPSFFDEVCYTGSGSATTKTHNLGVTPELMIVKSRTQINPWAVYLGGPLGGTKTANLDKTYAAYDSSGHWNNTQPTSSVFSIGNNGEVNDSGINYVAYLFATCPNVSKVGSYSGNGTTQTINCGFTGGARFVLIKRTDSSGNWYVYDTARGMTVLTDPYLLMNSSAAEVATLGSVTTVTTGFALNSAILAAINVSGGSYIFLAIS